MTLAEYMDPGRFPETTQEGLTPQQQMMIDAVNYDDVVEAREAGRAVADGLWKELEAKHAARAEVAKELNAAGR